MDNNKFLYNFKDRLNLLIDRDKMHKEDIERKALFYILAGNLDLYEKVDYIYDFKNHIIIPECLESREVDFSSSSRKLIKLAFNLFNGFPADVLDSFYLLDEDNFELAINAIKVRFGHSITTLMINSSFTCKR
ncbi:MAG: DUF6075 family protein [Senegalia sp. (in: firmicutes)]|uniref:DUF6075 family protein n=1 Tax=Senegalia sp. (in: firmicutes) TaxID=1924098 RepID=UPI003F9DDA88